MARKASAAQVERAAILARSLLFSGLGPEDLAAAAGIARETTFKRGESIFNEGDVATGFYLLAEGQVKLCKLSADGREKVLHFVHPGETFAEAAVFGDGTYPAEARAVAAGRALFFPRADFLALIRANPVFAGNLIASLSLLLRKFAREIEALSFAGVPARLAGYLLEVSRRERAAAGVPLSFRLEARKGEIASRIGTVSETISRAFRRLREEGLVELRGKQVTILDIEGLRRLARSVG